MCHISQTSSDGLFFYYVGKGLHEVLMFAIQKSDMDLRKVLYQNIVLSGGSTLFRGFGDRLLAEIRRLAPKDMKIRVSSLKIELLIVLP